MPGYVTVKFPKRKVNEKFPKAIRKKKNDSTYRETTMRKLLTSHNIRHYGNQRQFHNIFNVLRKINK